MKIYEIQNEIPYPNLIRRFLRLISCSRLLRHMPLPRKEIIAITSIKEKNTAKSLGEKIILILPGKDCL